LILAISSEVIGTLNLKVSDGFTKLWPSLAVVIFYSASFYCLSLTLKRMDVSVVYAIWSAAGTALIALAGIVLFKEAVSVLKLVSLALIIAGVVGLNLSNGGHG